MSHPLQIMSHSWPVWHSYYLLIITIHTCQNYLKNNTAKFIFLKKLIFHWLIWLKYTWAWFDFSSNQISTLFHLFFNLKPLKHTSFIQNKVTATWVCSLVKHESISDTNGKSKAWSNRLWDSVTGVTFEQISKMSHPWHYHPYSFPISAI